MHLIFSMIYIYIYIGVYDEEIKQEHETLPLTMSVAFEKRKFEEENTLRSFEHKQISKMYCKDVEQERRLFDEIERLKAEAMGFGFLSEGGSFEDSRKVGRPFFF